MKSYAYFIIKSYMYQDHKHNQKIYIYDVKGLMNYIIDRDPFQKGKT